MSERAKREFLLKQQNRDDLEARGSADRVETQQDLPLDRPLSWPPKVKPEKLRRLYQAYAARGIVDEDQINDIGYALYDRCRAIWCVTECCCPECTTELVTVKIDPYSCLQCPSCGWVIRKRRFASSHRGKRLVGGSAYPAFLAFLRDFRKARDAHQKMLAIDRLVHAFHGDYQGVRARLRRTACASILEGSDEGLARMLDELAYGENVDPQLLVEKSRWRAKRSEAEKAVEEYGARKHK